MHSIAAYEATARAAAAAFQYLKLAGHGTLAALTPPGAVVGPTKDCSLGAIVLHYTAEDGAGLAVLAMNNSSSTGSSIKPPAAQHR
jgi:hypothetical protein